MSIGQPSITGRVLRSSLVIALAAVLALALVAPALAVSGPTRLSDPSVTPRSASPADVVVFSVVYRNREGSPPDEVRVAIDGTPVAMSSEAGDDTWKSGVRFTFASTLPSGTHAVVFSATDRERFTDEIDGGSVTVVEPAPPPPPATTAPATPAPSPTPTGAPAPTRAPAPTGTSTSASEGPGAPGAAAPTSALEAASDADAGDSVSAGPGETAPGARVPGAGSRGGISPTDPGGSPTDPGGSPTETDGVGPNEEAFPAAPGAPGATGGGSTGDSGAPDGRSSTPVTAGWGDFARALEVLGIDAGHGPLLQVMTTLVSTTGGVALVMAFMFFGKRRRDGEPPAPGEVLHASAARGTVLPSAAALVPGPGPAAPVDLEASMPRWRRPSLLEARKADPLRDTTAARPSLSFDHGVVGPIDGHERRLIRYRVVRLLDAPDELRSAEIGFLDQGDEVQLLERSGAYWLVLCPDGRRGWLHRMTLGDVVGDAPGPGPRETWATDSVDAASGIDEDVLTAFLAARGRA